MSASTGILRNDARALGAARDDGGTVARRVPGQGGHLEHRAAEQETGRRTPGARLNRCRGPIAQAPAPGASDEEPDGSSGTEALEVDPPASAVPGGTFG